jgi:hypothetical protein
VHAVDLAAQVGERLAPEAEDVAPRPAHREGLVGLPADRDGDRPVVRREAGPEAVELVELTIVAERRRLGPGPAQDVDVLRGAAVALLLRQVVALAGLFGVAAAGDDVHDRAALGQLIQRGELLRADGRDRGVGAQRDDRLDPLGQLPHRARDDERVGAPGAVRQQRVVVAALFEGADVAAEVG